MDELSPQVKAEMDSARQLADRYHFEFVDLRDIHPDTDLLRTIPSS